MKMGNLRTLMTILSIGVSVALLAALTPGASQAVGGGGPGGGNSLTVFSPSGDGTVNFGDTVAVAVSGKALKAPWVTVRCLQGVEVVYSYGQPVVSGTAGPFKLGPTHDWLSGAADCVAQLWETFRNAKPVNGASASFHVEP